MSALVPSLVAVVLVVLFAFVFLGLVPRYFLGARSGGGISGFKDRRKVVQLGALACFVSTIPFSLSIPVIFTADFSMRSLADKLEGLGGAGIASSAPGAVNVISDLLHSALFRAKWVFVGAGALIEFLLMASILAIVFLSRDTSRGPASSRKREHVLELDVEARDALEHQEA